MEIKYRKSLVYIIPLIISLAILVIVSRQAEIIASSHTDNIETFFSFSEGLDNYKEIRQEWRPRFLSNFLAGSLIKLIFTTEHNIDYADAIKNVASYWTVAWLFIIFLLFILFFKEKSLFYILGIFAGISYAYTPSMGDSRIYPWDLPALFIFCCFILIIKTKKEAWLAAFIPLMILFKETSVILLIAFLFWEGASLRKKIFFMGITILSTFLLKFGIDIITANPSPLFTMSYRLGSQPPYLLHNLRFLFSFRTDTALFIDAGLLLSLLLLPVKKHPIGMLKLIAVAFILGNFVFGVISEFRIWFEMIPISLYALDNYFFNFET